MGDFVHLPQAFLLVLGVTYRQNLIHDQDIRLKMGGYGEGKPDIHARRVTFNRRVQETFYLGKGDDLVKFLGNLASRHPKDRTIQKDIFASGEFGVKACPDLQETPDAPAQSDPSLGRLGDATEDFQKRALP